MEDKTAPCVAITERKAHRPVGGCMSIFFQFFDWNRGFARKKLFSRKLLPPVRAEQASKRFGGNEKMPNSQLHLIADEDAGSFPNIKKKNSDSDTTDDVEENHGTRSPGLVARLMGLESMPAISQESPKNACVLDKHIGGEENLVNSHGRFSSEGLSLDNMNGKFESRLQKAHKTRLSDRRGVTRFGEEGLHTKSVLSRSKHNHRSKLASSVKSPRVLNDTRSASRTSRLIDVAARILEPGLQATNRAKYTLAYSNSFHQFRKEHRMDEINMSPDLAKGSCSKVNSCKTCTNLVDGVDSGSLESEQLLVKPASVCNFTGVSPQHLWKNEAKPFGSFLEQGSSGTNSESNERLNSAFNHRGRAQNPMLKRDRMPSQAKLSNLSHRRAALSTANAANRARGFMASNRSSSGRTRPRMPRKSDGPDFDMDRKSYNERDSSISPARKRRIVNGNGQAKSSPSASLTPRRQKDRRDDISVRKIACSSACSMNRTRNKHQSFSQGERITDFGDEEVRSDISLTASRGKTKSCRELKETRRTSTNSTPGSDVNEDGQKLFLPKQVPMDGDTLGALLERTLEELNSQEEEKPATGSTLPKKPTALILQELISALTAENPGTKDDENMPITEKAFLTKAKDEHASQCLAPSGDHCSSGCILDVSFSNNSCSSSNLDYSSGDRLQCDADLPDRMQSDGDLEDSATSCNEGRSNYDIITDLINCVSCVSIGKNEAGLGLKESQLAYAKEIILNAELLLGDTILGDSNKTRDILINHSSLDELVTLACKTWKDKDWLPGFEETKESNQLARLFLFNCIVECFDTKYGGYSNTGFKAWRRLPLHTNLETLVMDGIRTWTRLAGTAPDGIIEWEMSHSLGKCINFDIESFETGIEIDYDILQGLVEEVVIDLWMCH